MRLGVTGHRAQRVSKPAERGILVGSRGKALVGPLAFLCDSPVERRRAGLEHDPRTLNH